MKKSLFILFLFVFSISQAQENEKSFGLKGGFGGPMFALTQADKGQSITTGGGGAAVFTNNLFFGGYSLATSSIISNYSTIAGYEEYQVQREHGGMWIGYIYRISKRISMAASLKTGFGNVQLNDKTNKRKRYDDIRVVSPILEFDYHIISHVIVSLGVGYDQFFDVDLINYTNRDFNKPKLTCSFKFGLY